MISIETFKLMLLLTWHKASSLTSEITNMMLISGLFGRGCDAFDLIISANKMNIENVLTYLKY